MTDSPDPRPLLTAAFNQASAVIKAVTADDLHRPTPCSEFDVDTLVRHLLGVAERIANVPTGTPIKAEPAIDAVLPDDPAAEFAARGDRAEANWSDDTTLAAEYQMPWGLHPGFMVTGAFAMEVTTHTWDLADAIGYDSPLDEDLGEAVLGVAHMALPAEGREGFPFDPPVPVADDASAYDRLAAWMGRRPVGSPT